SIALPFVLRRDEVTACGFAPGCPQFTPRAVESYQTASKSVEVIMAGDARKRQKKQERRTAKRKKKKHQLVRQQSGGLPERLSAATRYPILHCWITTSIEDEGIGHVVLSRELPGSQVAVASFLVDRYCLGVKDAFAHILPRSVYDERFT